MNPQKRTIWILIAVFVAFLLFVFLSNQSSTPSDFINTIDGLNGISIK